MTPLHREHLRAALLTVGACVMLAAFVAWTLREKLG